MNIKNQPLLIFYCFFSCANEKNEIGDKKNMGFIEIEPEERLFSFSNLDKNGYVYGEMNLSLENGKKKTINWSIYQNPYKESTISLPTHWKIKQEENTFLVSELDEKGNDYFIWMKHKKNETNITLEEFLNYFHEVLTTDTIEVCNQPILKEYSFPDRVAYYIECELISKNNAQIAYSYLTEDDENIYEFTFKFSSKNDIQANRLIFDTIMDNIYGVYPDISVYCNEPDFYKNRKDIITNPILVVEVLSPSTEDYDRGKKFTQYRSLPSFKEYVLISQNKPKVEAWYKQEENVWRISNAEGLDASIQLYSLDIEVKLADIYYLVDFEAAEE